MKVKVLEENCISCGACEAICPEVFELKDGISTVIKDEITDNEKDSVIEAMESCPTEAIREAN